MHYEKAHPLQKVEAGYASLRVKRSSFRAGLAPAGVQRLFSAHFFANHRHSRALTLIGALPIQDDAA
jgi:hypothetical protein